MKEEFIRFYATDKVELCGIKYCPDIETKRAVLFVHGLTGNYYRSRYIDSLAKMYTDLGYTFFAFNNRGYEYITYLLKDTDKLKHVMGGGSQEIFEECVNDIDGAIDYLSGFGYDQYVLIGHSYGCNKVAYYYSQIKSEQFKDKIKNVVLLAPCDVVKSISNEFGEYLNIYISECKNKINEGKGHEMVINKYSPLNSFSARTFINNFTENTNSDIFRYREDGCFSETLEKIEAKTFVVTGTADELALTQGIKKVKDYLVSNIKDIKVEFIEGANHNYLGNEEKLSEILSNLHRNY